MKLSEFDTGTQARLALIAIAAMFKASPKLNQDEALIQLRLAAATKLEAGETTLAQAIQTLGQLLETS